MSYFGVTETRQYNTLRQLTNITVPGQINMTYNYPTGTTYPEDMGTILSGENSNFYAWWQLAQIGLNLGVPPHAPGFPGSLP